MSRYMGSLVDGQPPPRVPKTKGGCPPNRTNKYADVRPSEQRNSNTQKRARRERQRLANAELIASIKEER